MNPFQTQLSEAARAYSESEATAQVINNNLDYQAFQAGARWALTSDAVRGLLKALEQIAGFAYGCPVDKTFDARAALAAYREACGHKEGG